MVFISALKPLLCFVYTTWHLSGTKAITPIWWMFADLNDIHVASNHVFLIRTYQTTWEWSYLILNAGWKFYRMKVVLYNYYKPTCTQVAFRELVRLSWTPFTHLGSKEPLFDGREGWEVKSGKDTRIACKTEGFVSNMNLG